MQLRKQILAPIPFHKRRSTIVIAAIALALGIGTHIRLDLDRSDRLETCAAGSYVTSVDVNGVPICASSPAVGTLTCSTGATNALRTDTGDVQTIGGTYTEATGELEKYDLANAQLTTLTGTTNSITKYAGTVWLSDSAITDDGTTITVDLDQTDRNVVVKRPGTSDSVTISKVPLQMLELGPFGR